LDYAVLVAGIAEVIARVLVVIRGIGYPAYVTSTFGVWLGLYLLPAFVQLNIPFIIAHG
jgi:hypothetical protein